MEFLTNIALFVPVGMFLLLLFGTRLWWVALAASFAMTTFIEIAQGSIPGRVPDERDLMANGLGAVIGVLIALVLTLPATLLRRQITTTDAVRVRPAEPSAASRCPEHPPESRPQRTDSGFTRDLG